MLETSFALSIVRERTLVKIPPLSSPLGGGGDITGGTQERSVCMSTVSCAFFISVTVSQCRSVAEGGAGGLQSTAGQGTSAYCRLREGGSTVKSLQ